MLKKLLSILTVIAIFSAFMCGCKGTENDNISSVAASEAAYSEKETSSISFESQKNSQNNSKTNSASQSSNKTSSKETESKKPANTQSESITSTVTSQGTNQNVSNSSSTASANTSSSTQSSGLAITLKGKTGVGIYHFQPHWTTNYGTSEALRMKEFEDVLKQGYFNTVIVSPAYLNNDNFWAICEKYDLSVWLSIYSFYDSSKTNINSFINELDKDVSILKSNKSRWDRFYGFHHEETIWRGQSNADLLAETEALYKKYGKRNFMVFATGEFSSSEGNDIAMDVAKVKKVKPEALKYMTDVAFDSYSVDVRDGASNGNKYTEWQKVCPNIVDGKSYYTEYTKLLLKYCENDVNVWFFPCAFTYSLWGGLNGLSRADEAYCIAHLEFFKELLDKQKYKGGLMLYTYQQFSNVKELGMQSKLVVTDENGTQLLRPNEPKWHDYSKLLKKITAEYSSKTVDLVADYK